MIWIIVGILTIAGGALAGYWFVRNAKKNVFPHYEEKTILNKSEAVLFGRLCRALPNCYIFPHASLSSFIEPSEGDYRRNPEPFDRLTHVKVDYAVFDGDLELVCVILLDTDTVSAAAAEKNAMRDRCLNSASVKVMRWNLGSKPSVEQIARAIMPLTNSAKPTLESNSTLNPDTVQRIYKAEPVPSNIKGLTQEQLDTLTPDKVLSKNYPHIWQRICLFAPEPKHLQKYLLSLSIQDRGETRAGFPQEALKEITAIQTENDRFLAIPVTGWQPAFVNR
jgi:uncharacterized protein YneF (UPF0154 family)